MRRTGTERVPQAEVIGTRLDSLREPRIARARIEGEDGGSVRRADPAFT